MQAKSLQKTLTVRQPVAATSAPSESRLVVPESNLVLPSAPRLGSAGLVGPRPAANPAQLLSCAAGVDPGGQSPTSFRTKFAHYSPVRFDAKGAVQGEPVEGRRCAIYLTCAIRNDSSVLEGLVVATPLPQAGYVGFFVQEAQTGAVEMLTPALIAELRVEPFEPPFLQAYRTMYRDWQGLDVDPVFGMPDRGLLPGRKAALYVREHAHEFKEGIVVGVVEAIPGGNGAHYRVRTDDGRIYLVHRDDVRDARLATA